MRYRPAEGLGDWYPLSMTPADVRAIRQAERSRAEALAADPEWWTGETPDRG